MLDDHSPICPEATALIQIVSIAFVHSISLLVE